MPLPIIEREREREEETKKKMEKISAACSMDWSIELEKALRSNDPARRLEAISQIGLRLQQWSSEPTATLAVSNMYGLVPGQDRLFANTILLRLADAFRNGDNATRRRILNIFLMELKRIMNDGRKYDGILAKGRVPNFLEMLKRVKVVFDTGDAEAKALALRLFGCWADLGKDSVQIRYMILLSLQSSDVSEVRAALFAAGCFCRLSEDFPFIVLEMLIGIISSSETAHDVKLDAVRVFAKMRFSYSIANRAYKAGKELMLCLQEDKLKAEMLSSLSTLAFDSSTLVPQQVESLLSSVSSEPSSLVRARALKYLYFLFRGGVCSFAVERSVLATLFNIIDDKELSPNFRCEVLQILHKIFCSIPPDLPCIDVLNFFSLLPVVKHTAQSSFEAERRLGLYLLVDIFCIFKTTIREHWISFPEKWDATFLEFQKSSDDHRDGPTVLLCDVILLITNEMNSLVKQMIFAAGVAPPQAKQEFISLLDLILHLVLEYPSLAHVVLGKLRCLMQTLVSECGTNMVIADTCGELPQAEISTEKHESILSPHGSDSKEEKYIVSELIQCICRFTMACLNILDETGGITGEVYLVVKSIVGCISQNSCDVYEIFSLNIQLGVMFNSSRKALNNMQDSEESKVFTESVFYHGVCWASQEWCALEFTKKLLIKRNYWNAYRAGMCACSEGAWFAAAFTFRKLVDGVQSDTNRLWVKSLMLFSGAESEIKLILFPKIGIKIINKMQTENDCGRTFDNVEREMAEYSSGEGDLRGCQGKFAKIHSRICSSEEILACSRAVDGLYYFQMWFLSLRSKVLKIVTDMLGLLDSHEFNEEQLNKGLEGDAKINFTLALQSISALASGFARLSLRLNNVAKEYDLLAVSFLDIDCKSFRTISRQALSCSVLAFCTSFALYFLNSPAYKNALSNSLGNMVEISQTVVLMDLIERFWSLDENFALELQKLMTVHREVMTHLQSRTQTKSNVLIDRASLLVYKHLIAGILCIQKDSMGVKDEEGFHGLLLQGIQLLGDVLKRWITIPCSIPKYFFRVRPCIGAELFIFNTDSKNPNELSTSPGFQLSLNLCVQLKNASRVFHVGVSKIYCILAVRSSDRLTSGGKSEQAQWRFQARESEEMVGLFDILLRYMRTDSTKSSKKNFDVNGGGLVTTYARFEPNKNGQGFSTCLLDVSALAEGSYPIKWHCCFIDRKGHHWSLLPLNLGSFFTIK